MKVRVAARSDRGRVRERNEDAFLVQHPLYAVADGMGGHRGGDVASSLALETLAGLSADSGAGAGALVRAIERANQVVFERAQRDRDLHGMGTTLTALLELGERVHLAHVGDSRAYLFRQGVLQQLTEDHTLVGRMVREGRLSPEEAEVHPQRSILTQALGVDDTVEVEELSVGISPGDRLLICSDGLTGMVTDRRVEQILGSEDDPEEACERLVEEANGEGGDDNITVVLLDFLEDKGGSRPDAEDAAGSVPGERASWPGTRGSDTQPHEPIHPAGTTATSVISPPDVTPASRGPILDAPETAPQAETVPAAAERTAGPEGGEPSPTRRRPKRRILLWSAALLAAAVIGVLALNAYLDGQWYVGDADGQVAIFNGIPVEVLGFELSSVEETTTLSTAQAETLPTWANIRRGITASSRRAASEIVDQIERDLQAGAPEAGTAAAGAGSA